MNEPIKILLMNLTIIILVYVVFKLKRKVILCEKEIGKLKQSINVLHCDVGFLFGHLGITKTFKQDKGNSDESKD